jgi:hypothetical protein
VGLERGPLSLVNTTEELLEIKNSGSGLETENTVVGIRHADNVAPTISKNLALSSPTSGGRSVGIVRSRTQATEFSFLYLHFTMSSWLGICKVDFETNIYTDICFYGNSISLRNCLWNHNETNTQLQ